MIKSQLQQAIISVDKIELPCFNNNISYHSCKNNLKIARTFESKIENYANQQAQEKIQKGA